MGRRIPTRAGPELKGGPGAQPSRHLGRRAREEEATARPEPVRSGAACLPPSVQCSRALKDLREGSGHLPQGPSALTLWEALRFAEGFMSLRPDSPKPQGSPNCHLTVPVANHQGSLSTQGTQKIIFRVIELLCMMLCWWIRDSTHLSKSTGQSELYSACCRLNCVLKNAYVEALIPNVTSLEMGSLRT